MSIALFRGVRRSDNVAKVQKELARLGHYTGAIDGWFGFRTEAAVREFQARHGLHIDGVVGPITWSAMFPDYQWPSLGAPSLFASKALEIAAGEVGTREKGHNAGRRIEEYLAAVGLEKGNPWCMAFVQWCIDQAAKRLHKRNPLLKSGHCISVWTKVPAENKVPVTVRALPGDIFIMNFGAGRGHTGFIESVDRGVWNTIEGNTNAEGSREGDGVWRRTRKWSQAEGLIRLLD